MPRHGQPDSRNRDISHITMSTYKSDFLAVLAERGFIHQVSDANELDRLLAKETVAAYIGFDCTATSLHAGSLVPIMMLYWLQKTGHRPIALMGGGTTRVGDPSGKDQTRQLLSPAQIEANKAGIQAVFSKFLQFGAGASDAIMVDNADWLLALNYVDFLREVGANVSVNEMIKRDSIAVRLERAHNLSFLEFNYMVLQAYDFVELFRRYDCRLQMGGSDQWGNIVAGIDLGRRLEGGQLFALTTPLLATASGAKMGKTAEGAVWLDGEHLSPYDYWQYWRNAEDADVGRFLRLFTTLALDEIGRIEQLEGAELNEGKKILANEATAMVHGREAALKAGETARQTFEQGTMAQGLPTIEVARSELEAGLGLLDAFVRAGLASSNGEARRHIRGGGARVNDKPISNEQAELSLRDLGDGNVIKLSIGKKRHALVKCVSR